MPKIICVPQGKNAYLTLESASLDIVGLYTNGFSSCVIMAVMSADRLALMHIDLKSAISNAFFTVIRAMPAGSQISFMYREDYPEIMDQLESYAKVTIYVSQKV